jgi:hypothetical protein
MHSSLAHWYSISLDANILSILFSHIQSSFIAHETTGNYSFVLEYFNLCVIRRVRIISVKRLLASSRLFVCLSDRMYQRGSHCTDFR